MASFESALTEGYVIAQALTADLDLAPRCIVVGRTRVFVKARAEAALEAARDRALRSSALKELEAAIALEDLDALEAAVAVATELRLDGDALSRARSRVAVPAAAPKSPRLYE